GGPAALQRFAQGVAGGGIPEPDHAIFGAGQHTRAIRAEDGLVDLVAVAHGLGKRLSVLRVPNSGRGILRPCQYPRAVRAEACAADTSFVPDWLDQGTTGFSVPDDRGSIGRGGQNSAGPLVKLRAPGGDFVMDGVP